MSVGFFKRKFRIPSNLELDLDFEYKEQITTADKKMSRNKSIQQVLLQNILFDRRRLFS